MSLTRAQFHGEVGCRPELGEERPGKPHPFFVQTVLVTTPIMDFTAALTAASGSHRYWSFAKAKAYAERQAVMLGASGRVFLWALKSQVAYEVIGGELEHPTRTRKQLDALAQTALPAPVGFTSRTWGGGS